MNIKDGMLVYEGSIADKSELKMSKYNDPYVSFSFSANKRRKKGNDFVNEPIVFTGDDKLWAWQSNAHIVNEIPIGHKCIIVLSHDIKKDKHVFNVNRILPLETSILKRGWDAVKGEPKPEPKFKPEPKPEPKPTEPVIPEDDEGLPF